MIRGGWERRKDRHKHTAVLGTGVWGCVHCDEAAPMTATAWNLSMVIVCSTGEGLSIAFVGELLSVASSCPSQVVGGVRSQQSQAINILKDEAAVDNVSRV